MRGEVGGGVGLSHRENHLHASVHPGMLTKGSSNQGDTPLKLKIPNQRLFFFFFFLEWWMSSREHDGRLLFSSCHS